MNIAKNLSIHTNKPSETSTQKTNREFILVFFVCQREIIIHDEGRLVVKRHHLDEHALWPLRTHPAHILVAMPQLCGGAVLTKAIAVVLPWLREVDSAVQSTLSKPEYTRMRRDEEHIQGKLLITDIPGKMKRGRPKTRLEKCWPESGRGDGQGGVEKEDL